MLARQCTAMQKVLQSCPEFLNDWCYQDLGQSQILRSPCPDWLKCHFCLGFNPMQCLHGFNKCAPGEPMLHRAARRTALFCGHVPTTHRPSACRGDLGK